jgi:hypothetical protein
MNPVVSAPSKVSGRSRVPARHEEAPGHAGTFDVSHRTHDARLFPSTMAPPGHTSAQAVLYQISRRPNKLW